MVMELDTEIQARVLDLLGRKIDAGRKIDLSSNVVEDTGLDSVSVMDFVMEIEDEFDITIPLDQVAEVRTVGDLAHAVEVILRKRVAAQGEPKKEGH
jgi:acyl carrier protein